MSTCSQCHAPLGPGARFCGACGAPVAPARAGTPGPTEPAGPGNDGVWGMAGEETVDAASIPGARGKGLLVLVIVVAVLGVSSIGAAAAYFLWWGDDDPATAAGDGEDERSRGVGSGRAAISSALAACQQRDGEALWGLMANGMRAEVRAMAQRLTRDLPPERIAEAYDYPGTIEQLDGPTFLTVSMHAPGEHENVCWRASEWTELASEQDTDRMGVLYELPSGRVRGIVVERRGEGWLVSQITKSLRPDEYRTVVASYAPPAEAPEAAADEPPADEAAPAETGTEPAQPSPRTWSDVCDEYVERACSCGRPGVCQSARRTVAQMRRVGRRRSMRDFARQGCGNGLASIARACP